MSQVKELGNKPPYVDQTELSSAEFSVVRFQHICCTEGFEKYSPEELRLRGPLMLFGKEKT